MNRAAWLAILAAWMMSLGVAPLGADEPAGLEPNPPQQQPSPEHPADAGEELHVGSTLIDSLPETFGCTRPECCPNAWFEGYSSSGMPCIFAGADLQFLKIDRAIRQPLVLNQVTGDELIGTQDLDFDEEPGLRIWAGLIDHTGAGYEVMYFGLNDWDAYSQVRGTNDLRIPGALAVATDDFFGADEMRVRYSTEVNNLEFNYMTRFRGSSFLPLAGFRYVNLAEQFRLDALDADSDISSYIATTENNLWGGQIGGRLRTSGSRLGIDVVGKVGLFGNAARQRTQVGDDNNTIAIRNSRTTGGSAAFVGEFGVYGTFYFCESVYFRAGYNLIGLAGIARAANQLDFSTNPGAGTRLVDDSSALLQGASLGLEARW